MWLVRKFIVRKHERGLLYRDGDFIQFLAPGTYRFADARGRYAVERFDITKPGFEHRLVDYLLKEERDDVECLFRVVETGADEVALVFHDERPVAVLGPAERKLYWKGVVATRVERFDLTQGLAVDARVAKRLVSGADARVLAIAEQALGAKVVPEGHAGLLYVDGELVETLRSGLHAFWRYERVVDVELVDLRVKTLEVEGHEILTKDKVALRVNSTATYRFVDAAKAVRAVKDPLDHLYKEVQLAQRAAVGTRTLDELLADETAVDGEVTDILSRHFAEIGLSVTSVGVNELVLPRHLKQPLAKVADDDNAAQASFASARS